MTVTEQCDLTEVLSRLDYWKQDPAIEANRGYRRFSVRGDATIDSADPNHALCVPVNVLLRDISRGGVSFLSEQYMQPGTSWCVTLRMHGYHILTQPIAICYCHEVQESLYLVGTRFVVDAYVLHSLGIDLKDLKDDIIPRDNDSDDAHFLPGKDDFLAPAAISK